MQTSKYQILTLTTVALLVLGYAGPAAAGTGETAPAQETHAEATEATEAQAQAEAEAQEQRPEEVETETQQAETIQRQTRPSGEAGPNYAMTLTGEVESRSDEAIMIRTTTGIESIRITPRTTVRAEPEVGEWVAVDFNRSGDALAIAEQIRPVTRYDIESTGVRFQAVEEGDMTRTRVRTDSGPGAWSGLTMTGEVVSSDEGALVLDTVTGRQSVKIIPRTEVLTEPQQGDLVAVDITRDTEGTVLAHRVRPARPTPGDEADEPATDGR